MSFLPGQRLSRCTCQGESHPGPVHSDGTYVGRSAPEIDVFEAQVCSFDWSVVSQWAVVIERNCIQITGSPLTGQVSQSGQWGVSPESAFVYEKHSSFPFFLPALQRRIPVVQHIGQLHYRRHFHHGNEYIHGWCIPAGDICSHRDRSVRWI